MAWVKIIPPEEAQGELKDQYDKLREAGASRFAEVAGVLTHHPKVLQNLRNLSAAPPYGLEGFDPVLAECIAVTVSATNGCKY